mgnify:CR=1 FL=1|jgi:quercetin dioxygenase-like cupin family protein
MEELRARQILKELGYRNIYAWQDPPGTYYDWHTHPEDEVRFILEGSITIGTEEGVYHLRAGDMLEVKAGTRHWARTEEGVRYLCGSR